MSVFFTAFQKHSGSFQKNRLIGHGQIRLTNGIDLIGPVEPPLSRPFRGEGAAQAQASGPQSRPPQEFSAVRRVLFWCPFFFRHRVFVGLRGY